MNRATDTTNAIIDKIGTEKTDSDDYSLSIKTPDIYDTGDAYNAVIAKLTYTDPNAITVKKWF